MKKILFLIFIALTANAQIDLGDNGFDLPAICDDLPSAEFAINLAPICLVAQVAAEAYPVLLPAANQLCQILEGTTAWTGVLQEKVNLIHDQCKVELGKLQNKALSGFNNLSTIGTSAFDLKKKLKSITDTNTLNVLALGSDNSYMDINIDEWDEINYSDIESSNYANKVKFNATMGAEYLAEQHLNVEEAINKLNEISLMITTTKTLKESQDLQARLLAELAFQQDVHLQIISQYMKLKSAEELENISSLHYLRLITEFEE